MAKTDQNFTMYVGERKTARIAVVDQDAADVPLNISTGFDNVKWAMVAIDPATGSFGTAPILEKKSTVAQSETGGNEIDFVNVDGTLDGADVQIINADTTSLSAGDYYHELEGFDTAGEGVVLATGTITILKNLVNT